MVMVMVIVSWEMSILEKGLSGRLEQRRTWLWRRWGGDFERCKRVCRRGRAVDSGMRWRSAYWRGSPSGEPGYDD
jgi:hypothetical protein